MTGTRFKKAIIGGVLSIVVIGVMLLILLRHQIAHQITLFSGTRTIANHLATPLDLTASYTTPAFYFDQIKQFPAWKTVPRGFQVFDHIPLQIDGMICLWGENNTKAHIVFPEQILGIEVKQKFDTLYVYHATFFTSPPGTPVYSLVFRYTDGSAETNEVLYGTDILDWGAGRLNASGPTGPNSKLAWVGGSMSPKRKAPLRFCLTAIKNPHSTLEVASIDLYSSKNQSAGCVMAMTTGAAGLMQ